MRKYFSAIRFVGKKRNMHAPRLILKKEMIISFVIIFRVSITDIIGSSMITSLSGLRRLCIMVHCALIICVF